MPVTLTITGNTGPEAVQEIFNFLGNLHVNMNAAAGIAMPGAPRPANTNAAPKADEPQKEEAKAEEPKKAKKSAAKEEPKVETKAEAPASKYTLQEVMDIAKKAIIDSGDEAAGKLRCEKINKSFGISRVRELAETPEKLDEYVEAIKKEFPAKADGGMFD